MKKYINNESYGRMQYCSRDHNPCNRCCCRSADDRQWKQTAEKKV